MVRRYTVTAALVATLVGLAPLQLLAGQESVTLSGTAKDEAKKPYTEYAARVREVKQGQVIDSTQLDKDGKFALSKLESASYVVELVDPRGKVVCTEGPFDMTHQAAKNDIVIDCDKVPAAWWLLAAAAAAGITSGVVTDPPASPAK